MVTPASAKAAADERGTGFGGGELVGIFEIVEKGQVPGPSLVERGEAANLPAAMRAIGEHSLRQRGNVRQRRRGRFLEECRLRHRTRRGPANDRTRTPLPGRQSSLMAEPYGCGCL